MSRSQLRGYQIEAVEAVVKGLASGNRSQVHAACGTGKTLVALHAASRICRRTGLVVVACPSLALLAQTVDVWARELDEARVLVVCGDETVGDSAVRVGDLPYPVTRDVNEIVEWLTRRRRTRRVIFTTHRSADVVGAGLAAAEIRADLLIVDEAHRTAGHHGKHSALLHHDHGLPATRRLYLTATPRYLGGGSRSRGEALVGMDDPKIFGPVHYSYPFGKAIADGWLDDYQIAVIGVTRPEVLETLRQVDDDVTLAAGDTPLRMAVVQTALAHAIQEWDLRRIITFTPRVQQAMDFATTLPRTLRALRSRAAPRVTARYVHGRMNVHQREAVLDDLRKPPNDGSTVVANAKCLTEGVDVPAVDAVLFTHPKVSIVDTIQAVGRALRRNPDGSGIATVIIPVLLPDTPGEKPDINNEDGFATLCQVVRALRAHDETLAADLDRRRTLTSGASGSDADPGLPPRMVLRLPEGFQTGDFLRHVKVRLLEETTSQWWASLAAAKRYLTKKGHLRPPSRGRAEGVWLSGWLSHQRAAYRAGALLPERTAALEQLGIVWDPDQERRQAGLEAARRFYRDNGHLRVAPKTCIDGIDLHAWLGWCRTTYRANALPAEMVRALETLGIVWRHNDTRWREGYAAAQQFHREHGHLTVPERLRVRGVQLQSWLVENRRDRSRGVLSAERVKLLDDLGMVWDIYAAQWEAGLDAARRYYREHGHLRVKTGTHANGIDLYVWIVRQRHKHRAGKLPPERKRALDELDMIWNPRGGATP